ncbi:DMT family transporter [Wandonia haliotis]|uniref:DMT family transporter n=1 Tax=Wandonia haliotis TaxID=574963 RepID=A0ABN1MUH3_9FLAO
MTKRQQYLILIHLVVIVWGYTGIMGRAITLSSTELVWYRLLIAFVSLGLFIWLLKRPVVKIEKKVFWKIVAVGAVVGLHWYAFFQSIKMSSVSIGIICLSTTTLHVSWLEPLMRKRRVSWVEVLLGVVIVFGISFILTVEFEHISAILVGLLAAFLAALFSVSNSVLVDKVPSSQLSFIELISGFVVMTGILLFQGELNRDLFNVSSENIGNLLFLGIICTSLAFIIAVDATKYLGAFTVSLSINLEPIYTMIMAVLLFPNEEVMDASFYLGSSIILAAVFFNGLWQYRTGRKERKKRVS